MRTYSEQFLARVESCIKDFGFKPTEFGRQAVGDSAFVLNLRRGRSPTLVTVDKVVAFMDRLEREAKRRNKGTA